MPSDYPGAIDNAATTHADVEDGVLAVQTELGVNPSGASATVVARLDTLDATVADKAALAGATYTGTHNFTGATVTGISSGGGNITAGTVIGQIPVWDGDSYEPATVADATAADVVVTPVGTIAATNVQAALAELDTEKSATGHTHAAAGVTVQDENANVATAVTQFDFQGAGVTTTAGTGEVIVTIPGGGGSLSVQDENGTALTGITTLDFQGAGVTAAAGAAGEVVVTVPGGGGGSSVGGAGTTIATGLWSSQPHSARGTVAMTAGRMLIVPLFNLPDSPNVDAMAVEVTAGVAATAVRLGLYEQATPGSMALTLVRDFGTIDSSTTSATLLSVVGTSTATSGKRIYLAAVAQGGAPTLRASTQMSFGLPGAAPEGTAQFPALRVDSVTGALPASTTPTLASSTMPVVWVRGA